MSQLPVNYGRKLSPSFDLFRKLIAQYNLARNARFTSTDHLYKVVKHLIQNGNDRWQKVIFALRHRPKKTKNMQQAYLEVVNQSLQPTKIDREDAEINRSSANDEISQIQEAIRDFLAVKEHTLGAKSLDEGDNI